MTVVIILKNMLRSTHLQPATYAIALKRSSKTLALAVQPEQPKSGGFHTKWLPYD